MVKSRLVKIGLLFNSLLFSLLLLSAALPLVAQGQVAPSWNAPVNFSAKMPQAWFPDIAVDGQGAAHIIFSGSDFFTDKDTTLWQKYDKVYYQPVSSSGEMPAGGPFNIAVSPYGVVTRSSVTVDNQHGLVHMIYRSNGSLYYQYARLDKATSPVAWSTPRNIDDFGSSYYSDIAVDQHGVVHVVWTQVQSDSKGQFRQVVMYRQSSDLGVKWSYPTMVASPRLAATKPVLKIDQQGGLHVSWDDGYDNYVANEKEATYGGYSHSFDNGETWSDPVWFGDIRDPIVQTVMVPFGANNVMLVWRVIKSQRIDYIISTDRGVTWGKPSTVPGATARSFLAQHFFDRYSLATDGADQVHLAYVGQRDGIKKVDGEDSTDLAVFHIVWSKDEWQPAEMVAQVPGYPEYPRLAVGPDRIHLVWFVRDSELNEGNKQLWYSSRSYATAIKPQAISYYTPPTPTIASITSIAATPTPLNVLPPVEDSPARAWMEEGYITAILSLVPVLLIGILIVGLVSWRTRHVKGK
jgi:hypothetical protein